ncbi:hypothetical protein HK100_004397, partial [Physocladia obscura]
MVIRLPDFVKVLSEDADGEIYDKKSIRSYIESLCKVATEFRWLTSIHAYDSLTDNFFETVWPKDWRILADESMFNADHLMALNKHGTIQDIWPASFKEFAQQCKTLPLPRSVDPSEFGDTIAPAFAFASGNDINHTSTTANGMSRKKLHEVDRFARVISYQIAQISMPDSLAPVVVVDVGAGQGYLTHRLSTEFPCVAVDFDQIQTVGSVSRGDNIRKGKLRDAARVGKGQDGDFVRERYPITYKTLHIDSERLVELIRELESKDPNVQIALVGLHACGDLSATTMLRTFECCESVRLLAVVPCCFNLLSESESPESACGSEGFPMSHLVRSLSIKYNLNLGYKSRNLACQNLIRFDGTEFHSHLTGHYKRALFDALLWHFNLNPQSGILKAENTIVKNIDPCERKQHKFRLGKMPLEAYEGDFLAYAAAALPRLGLAEQITDSQILEFLELPQYANAKRQIYVVHCAKSLMSRVLESLLLMDRYLSICDMKFISAKNIDMLNLFDMDESPRNM